MTVKDELEKIRAETPDDDEEAQEAEEAETTPETPDEDDAPVTTPAPPGVDPDALEKESKRHERAMAKIMGAAWEGATPCEKCGALGYLPPGFEPMPDLVPNPDLVACRDCAGHGFRKTPSLNEQYQVEPCTKCQGKGFVDRATYETMVTPAAPQPFAGAPMPPVQPHLDQVRGIWVDQFGQPLNANLPHMAQSVNGPGTP
jgi:hypothetical protein